MANRHNNSSLPNCPTAIVLSGGGSNHGHENLGHVNTIDLGLEVGYIYIYIYTYVFADLCMNTYIHIYIHICMGSRLIGALAHI